MKTLDPRFVIALASTLALACGGGTADETSSLTSTSGSSDSDDDETGAETLSTTITASATEGSTTDPSDSDTDPTGASTTSTTGTSTTTATTDPTTGGDPVTATVFDIQDGTVGAGTAVAVEGVIVTGLRAGIGVFVQEMAGGMNSGIYVDSGDIDTSGLAVGDVVDVVGVVREDADGSLADLTQIDASGIAGQITDTGADATATPVTVELSVLGDPTAAEPWEGVLVTVDESADVTVADENNFDEFQLTDGTDTVWVDDFLFNVYDDAGNFPNMGVGGAYESVTGPLNFTFGDFKIAPRSAADLAGYVAPDVSAVDVDTLAMGDLVITEIMYDPEGCDDTMCEYIEVYNDSGDDVNLNGLVISDAQGNSTTITTNVILPAGDYGLIGQTGWGFTTVTPLVQVNMPAFNNATPDGASVANSTITIDTTAQYTPQGTADNGYAWKLDINNPSATMNDDPNNWCYAPTAFEGDDFGSPGQANNMGCTAL